MRAAIYARVSTSDQNNRMQLTDLDSYVKARGWELALIAQDQLSGVKERPGLDAIMRAAKARLIDVVLVWKLDRFGRSTQDLLNNLKALESAGVRFIATTQGIDTDQANPVSRFTMQILAAVAELEREMIRERVVAGMAAAKARGVTFGRHQKIWNRAQAVEMRLCGSSIREIAKTLEVGTGTVHRLLSQQKILHEKVDGLGPVPEAFGVPNATAEKPANGVGKLAVDATAKQPSN